MMSEEKQIELKPCPFCGGEAIIHYPRHNEVAVLCSRWKCGATISTYGARKKYEVIELWNRRARMGGGEE